MNNILDLGGKIALVTGAGQGIGRQIALQLAAHNAGAIVVNDFSETRAQAVVDEVRALGVRAIPACCDVSDYAAVERMVRATEEETGVIDILVNNAGNAGPTNGFSGMKPFWETSPDEWTRWLGTNLYGVLNCCRAALPPMVAKGGGRIITLVSDAGRVGEPHLAVYSGAKAGAAGFMRAMAKALGRYNITANCVSLGGIATPGVQELLPDEETISRALKHYVIRRVGQPSDAANMVLFLASDAASWITGQTYPVNGGYSFAV